MKDESHDDGLEDSNSLLSAGYYVEQEGMDGIGVKSKEDAWLRHDNSSEKDSITLRAALSIHLTFNAAY